MRRHLDISDVYSIAIPADPALSSDGRQIVYVLKAVDGTSEQNVTSLWRVPTDGGGATRWTDGPADTAPAWSPDGRSIAFLRGAGAVAQVYVADAEASAEPRPLTRLPNGAGRPVWSPDGSRIAFTAQIDIRDDEDGGEAGALPVPDDVIVADRLGYKADGAGFLGHLRSHVHVVVVETGEVRRLTGGAWNAGVPAWSPDGSTVAFVAARDPLADLTLASGVYIVRVDRNVDMDVDTDDICEPELVGDLEGTCSSVTWSTAGDALIVTGRRTLDAGNEQLFEWRLDTRRCTDLLPTMDRSVMPGTPVDPGGPPTPLPDGHGILVCVRDRGHTGLYALDVSSGTPELLLGGDGVIVSGTSVDAAGSTVAVVTTSQTSYGEITVYDLKQRGSRTLTNHTESALPGVEFIRPEGRDFAISDGTTVHGWILRDPNASTPTPLLIDVHGGPHNCWPPVLDPARLYHQALAAQGWTVLLINPRGSDGYGDAFRRAIVGEWGIGDERDFLEPIDELVEEGVVDREKQAITGYSYGGLVCCQLTAVTDRFVAAVPVSGISDTVSLAGIADRGHWFSIFEFGATPHDDRDAVRRQSPIERVGTVRTPTLLLHGQADERCPVGQSEQWFTALQEQGVDSRLVIYPRGSHRLLMLGAPAHRRDMNNQLVSWVTKYAEKPETT